MEYDSYLYGPWVIYSPGPLSLGTDVTCSAQLFRFSKYK
jgi:hypothetical protein